MKRISARLFIALLTFAIGVTAWAVWRFPRPPRSNPSAPRPAVHAAAPPAIADQAPHFSSRYENPAAHGGLFHVVRSSDGFLVCPSDRYDERALVLSYDDKSIEPRANDPDAPTLPGFYLSKNVRVDFEKVEVIGKKVYFKTRGVGSETYEFSGILGGEIVPHFTPPTFVPFVKGILTRLSDGKVIGEEEIKFRGAVITRTKP